MKTIEPPTVRDGFQYCNPELGAEIKWNSEADEHNQWDSLGGDEKAELIAAFISVNETTNK